MTKLDKKFIENHQLLLVKDYLTRFLKEYEKTCEYFTLFIDLDLYNFIHHTFELII